VVVKFFPRVHRGFGAGASLLLLVERTGAILPPCFSTDLLGLLSQVTCGDHVKWITNEKSKKDRSESKGETMSLEGDSDLKRTVRIGDSRHRDRNEVPISSL